MTAIKKTGIKVVISGVGADEFYSGYYDHYLMHLKHLHKKKNYNINLKNWKNFIKKKIRNPILKNEKLFIINPDYREHIYDNSKKLGIYLNNPEQFNFKEHSFSKDLFTNRRLNELFHETVPAILCNEDLNAMMNSIENRAPFLNKDILNFCLSISPEYLIKNGYSKFILREGLKNILHNKVRTDRQKKGFNCSIQSLIDIKNKDTINYLLNKKSKIFEYINYTEFKKIFKQNLNENYLSKFLFSFISTKIFLDNTN